MARIIAWQPTGADVTAASLLMIPGTTPATIVDFAALTAYTYGQVLRGANGVVYWVTVAGTTGAAEPTHTDGSAASGTATLQVVRRRRQQLIICNDGSEVVYLAFGHAAVANSGIRLNANGGTFNAVAETNYCPQTAIYAIAAANTSRLSIQEF